MTIKKIAAVSLVLVFLLLSVTDAEAQKKKRRPTTEEKERTETTFQEPNDFANRLSYDILIGNFGYSGDFVFSAKFAPAYKITDRFSTGISAKMLYLFANEFGSANDQSFFEYGFGAFARYKIASQFYVQAEYDFDNIYDLLTLEKKWAGGPYVGAGYLSGFGDWTFGLQLLFIFNDYIRDNGIQNSVLEYWFGATYNF